MREAIRTALIAAMPEVGERVFEPHAATAEDGFPFLVVRELTGASSDDFLGLTTPVEVWAETARERFYELDALAEAVKTALNETVHTEDDERFYLEHTATGTDSLDEVFGGITRVVVFDATDLRWLASSTFEPDPAAALTAWAQEKWPTIQTDPATWVPSAQNPGVYFRYAGTTRILEQYPTVSWVEMRLQGHILTTSAAKRLEWTRRLHEALVLERNIPLSDGNPLYIEAAGADSTAHPIRTGQVTVVVRMGLRKTETPTDEIEHAFVSGAVPNQEVV
jgi:hypothetical protein